MVVGLHRSNCAWIVRRRVWKGAKFALPVRVGFPDSSPGRDFRHSALSAAKVKSISGIKDLTKAFSTQHSAFSHETFWGNQRNRARNFFWGGIGFSRAREKVSWLNAEC